MVEGKSEEVYFNRIARMTDRYSIHTKVSKDKGCADIVRNCAKEASRIGLEDDDIRVAVFDSDAPSKEDIEEAVRIAKEKNVVIMTSNLSFEVWLLMHLEDVSHVYTQADYEDRLSQLLGRKYRKSQGLREMISLDSVESAVARGRRSLIDPSPIECKSRLNTSTLWSLLADLLEARL